MPSPSFTSRADTLAIRLIGFSLLLLGGWLLYSGGYTLQIEFKGIHLPFPVDYSFSVLGLCMLFWPQVVYVLLAATIRRPRRLRDFFADRAIKSSRSDVEAPTSSSPTDLAAWLAAALVRRDRRFTYTAACALLAIVLIPVLVLDLTGRVNAFYSLRGIAEMIQTTRLDYSSADVFRPALAAHAAAITSAPSASSTLSLDILSSLYSNDVKTPDAFRSAVKTVYTTFLEPHLDSNQLVRSDWLHSLNWSHSDSESSAALLTILAVVCNTLGQQGDLLMPHMQARQLSTFAIQHLAKHTTAANLHNAQGVALRHTLTNYTSYCDRVKAIPQEHRPGIDEPTPLPELELALDSLAAYEAAGKSTTSHVAKARFLNNTVDLNLFMLAQVLVDNRVFQATTPRQQDLLAEFQPPKLEPTLCKNLQHLKDAILYSNTAEIHYTKAQLLALGGSILSARGTAASAAPWSDLEQVSKMAVKALRTSRDMGIPPSYFAEGVADQMLLEWLWQNPSLRPDLTEIAQQ